MVKEGTSFTDVDIGIVNLDTTDAKFYING